MKATYWVLIVIIVFGFFSEDALAKTTTSTTSDTYLTPTQVEERVRAYFADIPVMIEIARCESEFRHFTNFGTVLRGGAGGGMIGVFQFYEAVHVAGAAAHGLDLATLEGNLAYARQLYELQGTTPWDSSRSCWNVPVAAPADTKAHRAALRKQIKLLTELIRLLKLQQALQAP